MVFDISVSVFALVMAGIVFYRHTSAGQNLSDRIHDWRVSRAIDQTAEWKAFKAAFPVSKRHVD